MGGLTSLNIAVSGLQAAQAGISVTGHNMSNSELKGYCRQRIIQGDSKYQIVGYQTNGVMKAGLGADVAAIRQVRDKYLDINYRAESSRLMYHGTLYTVGTNIETIVGELQSDYRAQSVIQDMWAALDELSQDPGSADTRSNFISTAITFMTKASNVNDRLVYEQNLMNNEVIKSVGKINDYISKIKDLNYQIAEAEIAGDYANDYRDIRNVYLDELSRIIPINVSENPRNGMVDISTGPNELLKDQSAKTLGLRYVSANSGFVEPVFTSAKEILSYDPYSEDYKKTKPLYNLVGTIGPDNGTDSGELKAMLVARGLEPANYVSKPTEPDVNTKILDENGKLVDKYTGKNDPKYVADYKEYEKKLFSTTQSAIPKFQREFDSLINSIVSMVNNAFSTTVTLEDGKVVKDPNSPFDQDGGQHTEIFIRKTKDRFDSVTGELIPEDPSDYYSLYTIGNIEINPIFDNPSSYKKIALSSSGDQNDTSVLGDMLSKWNKNAISYDGADSMSIESFYKKMITDLGVATDQAGKYTKGQEDLLLQLDEQRMTMSGVSLDEELTNMMKYQHAYNASARIFNVIDSMLDKLINGTGRVGL